MYSYTISSKSTCIDTRAARSRLAAQPAVTQGDLAVQLMEQGEEAPAAQDAGWAQVFRLLFPSARPRRTARKGCSSLTGTSSPVGSFYMYLSSNFYYSQYLG